MVLAPFRRRLGGKIVARLKTGKFVGEISFLSGDISTAMVVATEPARRRAWEKEPLNRLLARLRVGPLAPSSAAAGKQNPANFPRFCAVF